MATERLEIKNFKGIKDLELEVKPFTVLTGPQSVGKSTVAKLLYFFRTVPSLVLRAARQTSSSTLDDFLLKEFRRLLPPPNRSAGRSAIEYQSCEFQLTLTSEGSNDANWHVHVPNFVRGQFRSVLEAWKPTEPQPSLAGHRRRVDLFSDGQARFFSVLKEKGGLRPLFAPLFIPAGRSFYSQIERDWSSYFAVERGTLDPFMFEFGRYFSDVREFEQETRQAKASREAFPTTNLVEKILSGKHGRDPEIGDYIDLKSGPRLPTSSWSSGQQESFPLVIILEKACFGELLGNGEGITIFVEEPEAHLYPTAQRVMVELLAMAFAAQDGKTNLFVTTHSPYVLSTLNTLLKAGQVLAANKSNGIRKAATKIVSPLVALGPDTLGAYYMDQAHCESMTDEETGLIAGRGIDDVSESIAEDFDALLKLQYSR